VGPHAARAARAAQPKPMLADEAQAEEEVVDYAFHSDGDAGPMRMVAVRQARAARAVLLLLCRCVA